MTTTEKLHYQDTFIREVRATYHPTDKNPFQINDPEQAAEFVRSVLIDNSREHFVALFLDGAHQVASYSIVAIGTVNSGQAHPREVLHRAILCGAVSLITHACHAAKLREGPIVEPHVGVVPDHQRHVMRPLPSAMLAEIER